MVTNFVATVYSVVGTAVDTAVDTVVDATVDIAVGTTGETTVDAPVDGNRSTYKLRPFATSVLRLTDSACVPYIPVSLWFGCLLLSGEGFAGAFGSHVGGKHDAHFLGHGARIACTGCALS